MRARPIARPSFGGSISIPVTGPPGSVRSRCGCGSREWGWPSATSRDRLARPDRRVSSRLGRIAGRRRRMPAADAFSSPWGLVQLRSWECRPSCWQPGPARLGAAMPLPAVSAAPSVRATDRKSSCEPVNGNEGTRRDIVPAEPARFGMPASIGGLGATTGWSSRARCCGRLQRPATMKLRARSAGMPEAAVA